MKLDLSKVTLAGVDCLDIGRLVNVSKICQKNITFGAVKLFSSQSHPDPGVVKIPHISYEQISEFLIKRLNSYVETDFVLIIEHDGFILNSNAWSNMFMRFDYIGAPWWYTDGYNVGNGGFSFRSKKLCEVLANDPMITEYHGEDFHICRTYRERLEQQGIRFAPECVARKFSFEGNPRSGLKWNGQFGFHHYMMSCLEKWSLFKHASPFTDLKFIIRFLKKQKERISNVIDLKTASAYEGIYTNNNKANPIEISIANNRLMTSMNGQRIAFKCFNGLVFFNDSKEMILEFRRYRGIQVLIVYKAKDSALYSSTFYSKSAIT